MKKPSIEYLLSPRGIGRYLLRIRENRTIQFDMGGLSECVVACCAHQHYPNTEVSIGGYWADRGCCREILPIDTSILIDNLIMSHVKTPRQAWKVYRKTFPELANKLEAARSARNNVSILSA